MKITFLPVGRSVAADAPVEGAGRPYTVVYDGDCRVCTRLARLLRRLDRRGQFEVVASRTPGVAARFPWIPAGAYAESLQLVGPGNRTWQGALAVEQILRELPKGPLIAWLFAVPWMRPLADRLYRWFARNRYRFGCGEHCQYRPPPPGAGDR